ncbi:MAG TPA: antibiotic biosynthesis monooxygenase [Gemmatimonadaceae bacterium]|nr:antibiotic biosynthesis monooxygenase [Gemmatimonadaceae bacterium]
MIARIWTTRVIAGRESEYQQFANTRSTEMFKQQPGCLGVLMLRGADGTFSALSLWHSSTDADALANSESYLATVAALNQLSVLTGESTVVRFQVHGGSLPGVTVPDSP